jgi:hypothetical protein
MRRLLGIFFILLYSVALLKPIEPLIEYYLRYDLFSKKLCLNLDRPELKCNGKCILMQRLKAAQEKETEPFTASSSNIKLNEYPVGFMTCVEIPQNEFTVISKNTIFLTKKITPVVAEIFHPPS